MKSSGAAHAPRDVAARGRRDLVRQQLTRADVDDAQHDATAGRQPERHLAPIERGPEELERVRAVRKGLVRVEHDTLAGHVVHRLHRHQHRTPLRHGGLQREDDAAALDERRIGIRRRPDQRLQALVQGRARRHRIEIASAVGVLGVRPRARVGIRGVLQPREVVADGDAEEILRRTARRRERIAAHSGRDRCTHLARRTGGRAATARARRQHRDRGRAKGRGRPLQRRGAAHMRRRQQVHDKVSRVRLRQTAMLGGDAPLARGGPAKGGRNSRRRGIDSGCGESWSDITEP